MSQLVDLYNTSDSQRAAESRQIPGRAVDYFDREHKVASGFTTGKKKGDDTEFTEDALNRYEQAINANVPPESFNARLPLHRYDSTNRFYDPGQPSS